MKSLLLKFQLCTLLLLMAVCHFNASAQTVNWGMRTGGTSTDFSGRITCDANQNIYRWLIYSAAFTLDSAGTPITIPNAGGKDLLLIKYNCNKVLQWYVRVSGTGAEGGSFNNTDIRVDSNGNIYASASFTSSATFYSSNGTSVTRSNAVTPNTTEAFLMKLNNAGIIQWVNTAMSSSADEGATLEIDEAANVYWSGFYSNGCVFTSTSGPGSTQNAVGSTDIFIAKYNSAGVFQFVSVGGSNRQDIINNIGLDSAGNVYAAGSFGCCLPAGMMLGTAIFNQGNWGAFVAKMNPAGTWLWANAMGTANDEGFSSVAVDNLNKRVYVVGHFVGNSTITSQPGGSNTNVSSGGLYDIVLASFNLNGALQWVRSFGGGGNDYGYGLALDLLGNPVISGDFQGSVYFGGTTTLNASGNSSAYVVKFNAASGNPMYGLKVGNTTGYRNGGALYQNQKGIIYLGGYFTIGNIIANLDTLVNAGAEDAYLIKISDVDSTIIQTTSNNIQCIGDTATIYVRNKTMGTFKWFRNDTLITISYKNKLKVTQGGTYKVVDVSPCQPPDTSNSVVVVKGTTFTTPRLPDQIVCLGDSARYQGNASYSYAWSPGLGLSDSTATLVYAKPRTNTTYKLVISAGICKAYDTVYVLVQGNCCLTCSTPYSYNQGLVACYPFSGNANDESGNGNNGAVIGATLTTDRFNRGNSAYLFNGFNQYINVPNSASLSSPAKNLSISFWGSIGGYVNVGGVLFASAVNKSNTPNTYEYRFAVKNNGVLAWNKDKNWNATIGTATPTNTWFFFTLTLEDTILKYYRNGILVGTSTTYTTTAVTNNEPLHIGRGNPGNPNDFYNGKIDEVRVYSRVLSPIEVINLYKLSGTDGLPTAYAGLDSNICDGDSIQFNATVSTLATPYWNTSSGLSDSTSLTSYAKPLTTKSYILTADLVGCKNRDTVVVKVTNFHPKAGTPRILCLGDSLQLSPDTFATKYRWTPNYRISDTTAMKPWVKPLLTTTYKMKASNAYCTRQDTVMVTVGTISLTPVRDTSVCVGDSIRLNIATNGVLSYNPKTFLSDTGITNPYCKPTVTTTYYITSNFAGCVAKDTFVVNVSNLTVDAGSDRNICLGDSVQLAGSNTGNPVGNFRWTTKFFMSDSTIATPYVKPNKSYTYTLLSYNGICTARDTVRVTVNNPQANAGPDKSICLGDTVRLNGTANGVIIWSPVTGVIDTGRTPRVNPITTTPYIMIVNQGGCLAADTAVVTVVNFSVSAGTDKQICIGDSVQLIATGATKYNWMPLYFISDTSKANPWVKPLVPTNYYVSASNGICVRKDTVFVNVVNLTAQAGIDTSMCKGGSVKLSASGGTTFLWQPFGNINDSSTQSPLVSPPNSTSYIVKVGNGTSSCYAYDTVNVRVILYPSINAGPDVKVCKDSTTQLLASAANYTALLWSPSAGLSDIKAVQPFATITKTTSYILSASNYQCAISDTVKVIIPPPVIAAFTPNPQSGAAPLTVLFNNQSQNGVTFNWYFGEPGAESSDSVPTYVFTKKGIYHVVLTAMDSTGCIDTASKIVNVNVLLVIFMPNAFSPNNDGLNDVFEPVYPESEFEYFTYQIFNRWGVMIYETRYPGGAWWNGYSSGVAMPPDLYTYSYEAKDIHGRKYQRGGSFYLMR